MSPPFPSVDSRPNTDGSPHTVLTFVFMEQLRKLSQLSFINQQQDTANL
jgi:hypothetical protein